MAIPSDKGAHDAEELLDALPYGVVVVSRGGTVVRANAAARELLPRLATTPLRRCSKLFACRAPGGPCESGCLAARAMESSEPPGEVLLDPADLTSARPLWVTASPLPGAGGAVLGLRPDRGEREPMERGERQPQFRIRALGRTRVEARDDALDAEWLSQKPGRVLKYLLCERTRIVVADEIAETIWPESGPRAIANTRYAIHRLRTKLEPRRAAHDPPAFVVARGGGYALDRERVWIDADEFEREIDHGRAALTRGDPAAASEHLERASALYRGVFLADEPYAHWAVEERHRLEGMAIYGVRMLAALARERGDATDAIRHLKRLAALEPLDSLVHRELIQALLADGQRSEAKRRFDRFADRLQRELGEVPDFDLRSKSFRRWNAQR